MAKFVGKVAVVTGASKGIGASIALHLAAEGAAVVVNYASSKEGADRVVAEIAAKGGKAVAVRANVASQDDIRRLFAETREAFGRLDILVNNAGVCDDGPLHERPLTAVTDVIDLNLVAAIDLCRLAAPLLFARPGSTVINVASIYGLVGSREPLAAYNASKGALVNLTRHLAAQWGPRGVRVNALAPGFFPTDMTGHLTDLDQRNRIEQRTLLGRVPDLAELDGPLLFLAGDGASYVTGHVLAVDGGWTAG
jgi:3-oxoacyl-[acyl-carrier protein] reductase